MILPETFMWKECFDAMCRALKEGLVSLEDPEVIKILKATSTEAIPRL